MDPIIVIAIAFVTLLLGGGIGWFLGGRMAQAGAETAMQLRSMLDGTTKERDEAREGLARIEATLEEREKGFEQQKATLGEAKDQLSAQFGEIGKKMLGEAQDKFLQRADERFNQAGEKSEEKLKLLLNPVGERLKAYEEQVGKAEEKAVDLAASAPVPAAR